VATLLSETKELFDEYNPFNDSAKEMYNLDRVANIRGQMSGDCNKVCSMDYFKELMKDFK
jgi:hypothetical protein